MTIALRYTDGQHAFRAEVRAWMTANVPREPLETLESAAGFAAHREWERTLARGRWGMVTWPEEYGGRGCDLIEWLIFEEEYYRAGAPARVNQNGIFLLGPTLMEFGTPEQKARFLPRMAAGEEIWAQAWSEPQAGSDLAALRATATARRRRVRARGHKIWSSRAVFADWGFGLFRTDPRSERHKGLSFILFPLDAAGRHACRPIPQIDGETGFAEIFFDDVRVPVANRLGEEGAGLEGRMATAGFERGLMLRSPGALPGGGEAARRALPPRMPTTPSRRSRTPGGAGVDGRRGLRAEHLRDRLAADGRRHDRRRGEPQQDLLVGDGPAHAPDRAAILGRRRRADGAGARRRRRRRLARRLSSSRSPGRSTPARTRSSATSSPSGCCTAAG